MKLTLTRIVIIANVVFVLWIVYNGIDSGFVGTKVQIASFISLVLLLALNVVLLATKKQ